MGSQLKETKYKHNSYYKSTNACHILYMHIGCRVSISPCVNINSFMRIYIYISTSTNAHAASKYINISYKYIHIYIYQAMPIWTVYGDSSLAVTMGITKDECLPTVGILKPFPQSICP